MRAYALYVVVNLKQNSKTGVWVTKTNENKFKRVKVKNSICYLLYPFIKKQKVLPSPYTGCGSGKAQLFRLYNEKNQGTSFLFYTEMERT